MKKKEWIILGVISAEFLFILIIMYFVFQANTDEQLLPLFGAILCGYVVLVGLICLLYSRRDKRSAESFEMRLSREGFSMQKVYTCYSEATLNNTTVCIDFDSKRFACNLLYKYIVPFERIASSRIEFASWYTGLAHDDELVVSLVISVREAYDEFKYFYISMFDVVVDKQDVGKNEEITPELLAKYPDLQQICDLQQDMLKLLEINAVNGDTMREATDEEWQQLAENAENAEENVNIDQSDDEQYYTKPPFSNSRW